MFRINQSKLIQITHTNSFYFHNINENNMGNFKQIKQLQQQIKQNMKLNNI